MENQKVTPPTSFTHDLVLDYLRHSGRDRAFHCFEKEAELPSSEGQEPDLSARGEIRRRILSGDAAGAVELICDFDSELLDLDESLIFELRIQVFSELVREPGYDLDQALLFASEEFVPCPSHMLHRLEEVMALLAFDKPSESPLSGLLNRREQTATEVNKVLVNSHRSRLAKLLSDASCLNKRATSLMGGAHSEDLSSSSSQVIQ